MSLPWMPHGASSIDVATPVVHVGSIVRCNHCGERLYRVVREIRIGELAEPSVIEAIPPHPQPRSGDAVLCSHCGRQHDFTVIEDANNND